MKKIITGIILFFSVNILIMCTKEVKKFNFHVNIKQITHGAHPLYTYDFTQNNIKVIKHSTNDNADLIIVDRILEGHEKKKLYLFLKTFPLNSLKNEYINRGVKGEVHTLYSIQIKNEQIKTKLYFVKQPDLNKLVQLMNRFIPYEHSLELYD